MTRPGHDAHGAGMVVLDVVAISPTIVVILVAGERVFYLLFLLLSYCDRGIYREGTSVVPAGSLVAKSSVANFRRDCCFRAYLPGSCSPPAVRAVVGVTFVTFVVVINI